DKQIICSCEVFQQNNSCRDLCQRFVAKGDKLYDIISWYDDVATYVLNRTEWRSGSTSRFTAPFLKAFGMTDYAAMEHCGKTLTIMPEAKRVIGHLRETMPTFFTTSSYEHNVLNLCRELDIPRVLVNCMDAAFDDFYIPRQEAKAIRELANRITGLRMPHSFDLSAFHKLQKDDVEAVMTIEEIFNTNLKTLPVSDMIKEFRPVGTDEKVYFMIDLRDRTQIELEGTAFIGGDMTDVNALDRVSDLGGLALSFNGCDLAVRRSNIAVMSRDCTVTAVLAEEFYNEGIEAVFDLVENWDREKLKKKDFPDPHLMSAMLASNPRKLPEVHIVNKDNVDEIARKSNKYRKNLSR
ncbi:MAG: hypothetical protein FWG60_00055, partial [Methanomassiliicoccaceae archaeon]|nr:hypothetical protein [Methanomassiliicoccaceae archaeon]